MPPTASSKYGRKPGTAEVPQAKLRGNASIASADSPEARPARLPATAAPTTIDKVESTTDPATVTLKDRLCYKYVYIRKTFSAHDPGRAKRPAPFSIRQNEKNRPNGLFVPLPFRYIYPTNHNDENSQILHEPV